MFVSARAAERPNFIFILADDLGIGDLGRYGQKKISTPRLDQMAREGMRFTQAYAGNTVCAPSRCALMTGKHMGHAQIRGNDRVPLRPEDLTIAEVLRGAGYRTALSGKWGLGEAGSTGIPTRKGFDHFFGYLNQTHAHNHYPDFLWRNEEKITIPGNQVGPEAGVSVKRARYAHDLILDDALSFLRTPREEPFFLYLSFIVPHTNNERKRATGDGMEVPDYGPYTSKDWPISEKGKAAMIHRLDEGVGRVLDELRTLGIDEKTLVIFTSDNGPHKEGGDDFDPEFFDSNGRYRGIKRDLYEGGIRVPAIARWPGTVAAGVVSDQVWAFWDVLPTLADLAGQPAGGGDGVSIASVLKGGPRFDRPPLYWEFHEGPSSKQAVRHGDWKGVRLDPLGPLELYDLSSDPGESGDVADVHPEVVKEIEAILATARTEHPEWPLKSRRRAAAAAPRR
jgi:arylsulfatase A-like enzyme